MTRPFWMVCRAPTGPQSVTEPRKRYPTLDAARSAAQQLANQTGAEFVVLEAVQTIHPGDDAFSRGLF